MEIKVGDYIGVINSFFSDCPPFRRALEVVAVGKTIKCPVSDGHRLFKPEDVLCVFASKAVGDACMEAAHAVWLNANNDVSEAIKNRNVATETFILQRARAKDKAKVEKK
jgi:hypothetical protein